MKDIFAGTSLALSLAAIIPYIFETVKGKVKPERISWLLWTMLGATYYASAVIEDGAVWYTFGELIGPVIALGLAIKYGVGGKSRFDLISLGIALVAFVLLFVVEGALISLALALFVDSIGSVLTIRKLVADPASESRTSWAMILVSAPIALLSLQNYTLETTIYPIYVIVLSAIIVVLANPNKVKNVEKIESF